MTRTLILSGALVAALALLAPAGSTKPRGAATQPRLVEMKVRPAAAPRMALKWRLLPEMLDQTPGNAALLYGTATNLALGPPKRADIDRVIAWLDMDPDKLPRKEIIAFVRKFRAPLRQLELAARRERCHWDLPIRTEGFRLILPSLSAYRNLARILSLKARVHVAAGRYDQAVHEIQTGLAMARHLTESPTLIHALVGAAVASQMLKDVESLIQSPGSPNLYWALAAVPRPFVDFRKAIAFERDALYLAVPKLRTALTVKRTPREWQALSEEIAKIFQMERSLSGRQQPSDTRGRLAVTAMAIYSYPLAKKYLLALGKTPEQVEAMPVQQAIAIYYLDGYERIRGEVFKWHTLPYWQAHEGLQRAGRLLADATAQRKGDAFSPLVWLVPSLTRARFITAKLDRHIAALQCIEAVRMYAADHDGKPPAALADIRDAPCPIDPVTGKAFVYQAAGRTVTLDAPAPRGLRPTDGTRYRVTLVGK